MQSAAVRTVVPDGDIHALLTGGAHAEAFDQLLERYRGKVYRLCCALLRDPAAAEDAAQESLVRIWRALPSYDGRASLSTWIYTITRNRCLTAIGRRRELASIDAEIDRVEAQMQSDPEEPDDSQVLLRELVDGLPERYRRVLALFYYEDRSVSEVAEMLAMPEGTVKTALHRARGLIAADLKRRGLHDARLWLGGTA
ncbi:MAG TPA: RNA polymerase sigma factor [Steroidobacteraceae bacterium]|nr:RNA polymerase sigma factor [Steroidobacteraceae bacterium]